MTRSSGVVPDGPLQADEEPGTPGPAPAEGGARGRRRTWLALALVVLLALAGGVTWLVAGGSDDAPAPVPPATPTAEPPPVLEESAEDAWQAAWAAGDVESLRAWFGANTGPTVPVEGTVPGGEVRNQADADALTGHVVTSRVTVDCDCLLRDFVLVGADLWIDGGDVTVQNVLLDGQSPVDLTGALTVRGNAVATLSGIEIVGHHDGIRAYADSVLARYVYIHGVAAPNPREHHQDGIQTISGVSVVERSFIDMTGANTSAVLIKPDAGPVPLARISETLLMGGQHTIGVHDGPEGAPELVELQDILVAPGYRRALASIWDFTGEISAGPARVAGSGATVELVDGARL